MSVAPMRWLVFLLHLFFASPAGGAVARWGFLPPVFRSSPGFDATASFHDGGLALAPGRGSTPFAVLATNLRERNQTIARHRTTPSSILAPLIGAGDTKQADVSQVRLNAVGDSNAVQSSLIFSIGSTVSLLIAFTLLRRWNMPVYSREERVHAGPPDEPSQNWVSQVLATDGDREMWEAGLDGWSLIEFYRFHRRMLCVIGPPILLVIGPVNYVDSPATQEWLSRLDISNTVTRQEFLWLYSAFVWFVVIAVSMLLYGTHQEFLEKRYTWLKTIPRPQATTVLLENIPHHIRTDAALVDYFQGPRGVFIRDSQIVENAYIVRRTNALRQKWEALQETQKALDVITHRREGAGEAPLALVNSLQERLKLQQQEVNDEQAIIERGVKSKDLHICAPSGFVTFTSGIWQRLCLKEHFRADRTELVASFPPAPDDVMYENLVDNAVKSFTWFCLGWLCLIAIFFFWSPLVIFISSWTTLPTIKESVPAAEKALNAMARVFPWVPHFVEGILATAALRFFLAFLPLILLSIIRTFFPVKAGAMAQFRLGRWYFSFLLIFVLLVTTLGRGLVVTAVSVAGNPSEVIKLLSTWLPQASHFYFHYMIFGWATLAFELLRIPNLVKYWYYRLFYKCHVDEAKKQSEPEDQASFGMGARMGVAALMSSMTLVFCLCSPLMLVFSFVYFALGRITYGYLLVQVEERRPDTGGRFWVEFVNQVFFILTMFVLLMTGVLAGQEKTYRSVPAACALSSGLALYAMWYRIKSFEWETLPLEQMSHAYQSRERLLSEREQKGEYRQQECRTSTFDSSRSGDTTSAC